MKRNELITQIATKKKYSEDQVKDILEGFIEILSETVLLDKQTVNIHGFGTFKPALRKRGGNSSLRVRFIAARNLKSESVQEKQSDIQSVDDLRKIINS